VNSCFHKKGPGSGSGSALSLPSLLANFLNNFQEEKKRKGGVRTGEVHIVFPNLAHRGEE
jgi:hypothetical protein